MTRIFLTDEQVKLLHGAHAPVAVCDPFGNVLGTVDPQITAEFIAEMKRRAAAPGPRYTSEQVRNHLRALEEAWAREGPFDEIRMMEILEEARAKDSR